MIDQSISKGMRLFFAWIFFDGKRIGTHTIVATWNFHNAEIEVNGVCQNFHERNVAWNCVVEFSHTDAQS
jgi:hypothetical protein